MIDTTTRNEAVAQIVEYLEGVCRAFGGPNAYRLLIQHGIGCAITAKTFTGRSGPPRQCYANAFDLALRNPRCAYVEGFLNAGLFLEHAWCVDRDGHVIEPTLRPALGDVLPPSGYYGIPFAAEYVRHVALTTRVYGIISYTNRALLAGEVPPEVFLAPEWRKR